MLMVCLCCVDKIKDETKNNAHYCNNYSCQSTSHIFVVFAYAVLFLFFLFRGNLERIFNMPGFCDIFMKYACFFF